VRVGVLGPVEVVDGTGRVDVGTRKQRALLAALVLHRRRAVSVDALVDLIWGDDPPSAVLTSLHGYIAGLRRALEPDRAARKPASVLVTVPPGYALRLADDDVDATRFAGVVGEAHRRLAGGDDRHIPAAPAGLSPAELTELADRLDEALRWWRGAAYADLDDVGGVLAERARLAELRLVATEDLALVRLELGEHATVAAELEALAHLHPLRERLWALWVLALARAGRQAAAFEALRTARRQLADDLGVDPGASLRALETAILHQDPALSGPPRPTVTAPPAATAPAATEAPAERVSAATDAPAGLAGGVAHPGAAPTVVGDPRTWPLVGRDAELATLTGLLAEANQGHARFAAVIGEPGVGKSRLVDELGRRAVDQGFAVLVGRCSEDEGAPPFWPWTAVVRDLAGVLGASTVRDLAGADAALLHGLLPALDPGGTADADGAVVTVPPAVDAERFRICDAAGRLLAAASAHHPLLVALDDLHWADPSTLRLLQHLAEHLNQARILLVATRRQHPEPVGALAEVGEALGRRHALRLDLAGLDEEGVAGLVTLVTGGRPAAADVSTLRERTDGNPFFLVELLRLPPTTEVPAAVTDVVARRVARLPDRTRDLLQTAAVIGRRLELGLLAAAAERDPDSVLDDLDPALAAGVMLEEPAVESFRFAHALVRDVVYHGQPATRRARRHALVAAAMEHDGNERLTETARHWLAAGPRHAATAWRCAARAAEQAQRLHGYEEAATLLAAAVAAQDDDRTGTAEERYALSMAWADACRWSGDRAAQLLALDRARQEADALGDLERLAYACVAAAEGAMWTVRDPGVVNQVAVAALRRVLRGLPAGDSDLRCRALLALASELYYTDAHQEREALADEGLAMARRIGDPALLVWASTTTCVAISSPENAADRARIIDDALTATGLHDPVPDDRQAEQVARMMLWTFRALSSHELARLPQMWQDLAEARTAADRLRTPSVRWVLNGIELPWRAMRGDAARVEELLAEVEELTALGGLPQSDVFTVASLLFARIWQGRADEVLPLVRARYAADPDRCAAFLLLAALRAGAHDDVRTVLESRPSWVDGIAWARTFELSVAAHAAYLSQHTRLAATVYRSLAPYAGRMAAVGSAGAIGPVDAYLAFAAATTGERDLARRHADDARALAKAWELPALTAWLTDVAEF
jgi:DNA-binding SARP family transcriptional activator